MDEQDIFLAAIEKSSPAERTAWLNETCGDDFALRQRIVTLIERYNDAGSFLERPPSELEATAMGVDDTREDRDPDSNARTTLYDSSDDVSLDFLHPSDNPGCLGTIGQYEVQSVIGRGGMGVVLKAHDTSLHRTVAVKVLAPELAANPTARQRFIREARAAAAVTNPHVVTTHAVDEDRVPYIVMELVDGKTLKDKIDSVGMLGVKEILRIGSQIAHGLAAAHKQGLIHRDIKPGNILLENGVERVKITDFGLARAVDDMSVTRTGEVAGTPQYMSPEQAQGEGVDHRSDLFSLGSVLYAMCTGRPPFRGDNAMAVLRRVIDEPPRPIREVNSEIPDWLCDIVNKLLAKKPEERYQTAREVAGVLEESLARLQYPGAASPPKDAVSWPQPAHDEESARRVRNWTIGAVVGVVVMTGIIIKITQPDGTTVEIEADSGSRIEISADDDSETDNAGTHDHSDDDAHLHEHAATEEDVYPPPVPVDFNGTWSSPWGPVIFEHGITSNDEPYELSGTYGPNQGQIQGTVDPVARTFRGSFQTYQGTESGRLMMVLSADGQSIDGWYDHLNGPVDASRLDHEWNLTRQDVVVNFNGVWDSSWGQITLRHALSQGTEPFPLHGKFGPDAVIEGYVDPTTRMFKGEFIESQWRGRLWLELSPSGGSLQGWYDYTDLPVDGERPNLPWDMLLVTRLAPVDEAERPITDREAPRGSSADLLLSSNWEWTDAENLGPIINSPSDDGGPTLTADGLTLVFHSNRDGTVGGYDLWISTRDSLDDEWSTPVNLGDVVNSTDDDSNPSISGDGLVLVFDGIRPGGIGKSDLWITTRASVTDPWTTPVNMGSEVNSFSHEWGAALSADGLSLVLTSDTSGFMELWGTSRPALDAPWSPVQSLGAEINSSTMQTFAATAGDGLSLIFNANRTGGAAGAADGSPLWISTRASTDLEWPAPVRLMPDESLGLWSACLSGDHKVLLFDSELPGGNGEDDIWMMRRVRRVEARVDATMPPPRSSVEILTSDDWEWTEPVNLGPTINSPANEGGPTMTADGLTLVFHSNRAGGIGSGDLWISHRESVDDEWETPVNLGEPINSPYSEDSPSLSADGLIMLFESDRPGGLGSDDIWMATRPSRSEPWSTPVNLGEPVNSSGHEYGLALSGDGLSLIFTSASDRSSIPELWETWRPSLDAPWSPPRNLGPPVNSPASQGFATLASDGLSLIYNSNRSGGAPYGPMWIATRTTTADDWSTPVRLQPEEQLGAWSPCLSGDSTIMLFDSRRAGGQGNGDFDIWMTRRVPASDDQ